jgi:hypothetical protein
VTYYVQGTLGYSPIRTGLAFLPLIAMLVVSAQLASIVTLRHLGPRMIVPLGMLIAALGMSLLTQLSVASSYVGGRARPWPTQKSERGGRSATHPLRPPLVDDRRLRNR